MARVMFAFYAVLLVLSPLDSMASSIDFREDEFSKIIFKSTYQHDFIGGDLDGLSLEISANPWPALLWRDKVDGLGVILRFENDEVEWDEQLRFNFSEEVAINNVNLADFFVTRRGPEMGRYSLDQGATWNLFDATGSDAGALSLDLAGVLTDSIWFAAGGFSDFSTYALSGFDISYGGGQGGEGGMGGGSNPPTEVPEPASLLLLGSALLGLKARKNTEC